VTNAFGSRAPPEFTRGASALPRRPSRNLGRDPILLKEREGERQEKAGEGIGKEGEGDREGGREGERIGEEGRDRGQEGHAKGRVLSPLYLTSGPGPDYFISL